VKVARRIDGLISRWVYRNPPTDHYTLIVQNPPA
jgi:hypothetical protein